jgi:hypothetical protein
LGSTARIELLASVTQNVGWWELATTGAARRFRFTGVTSQRVDGVLRVSLD